MVRNRGVKREEREEREERERGGNRTTRPNSQGDHMTPNQGQG